MWQDFGKLVRALVNGLAQTKQANTHVFRNWNPLTNNVAKLQKLPKKLLKLFKNIAALRKKRQIGGNNVLGRITLTCTGGTTPICMCNTLLPQLCAKDSVPQYSSGWCVCCSTTGSSPYYPTTYGSSLSTGVGSYQSGIHIKYSSLLWN